MKIIRNATFFLLCMVLFSSCQKNYPKLVLGGWKLSQQDSYLTKRGERHYFSEKVDGVRIKEYTITFYENNRMFVKSLSTKGSGKNGINSFSEWMDYHFDGDCFFAKGDMAHIVYLSNNKMIIESSSEDEMIHMVLQTTDKNTTERFFKYIWYSFPIGLWVVLGIVGLVIIITINYRKL